MASILMHPSRLPQLSCVYITLIFPSPTQSLSPSLPTGTPPTHWHLLPFTGIHSGCRLSDVVWPIASGMKSSRKSPVQQAFLPLCFPCDRVPLAFVSPPPRAHSRRTPPSSVSPPCAVHGTALLFPNERLRVDSPQRDYYYKDCNNELIRPL
jgi:hypothetical protein